MQLPCRQPHQTKMRGSALVILTLFVVVLFAFAAISLDVGNVLREQRKAQIGTDAAAYAGALLLDSSSNDATLRSAVIEAATQVAGTNGVTATEIAAGNGGAIQLGTWTTNGFVARTLGPYDAVRVPARRTVKLMFGRVVGFGHMRPAVDSVAKITRGGMVPFGLLDSLLPSTSNTVIQIDQKHTGNWGKLDLGGVLRNPNDWEDAFVNGYGGDISANLTVDGIYEMYTDPGFAKLTEAWDLRVANNPFVVLPIVDTAFPNGHSGPVTIRRFAIARLLDQIGNGNGWKGNVLIIGVTTTPPTFQLSDRRELVK